MKQWIFKIRCLVKKHQQETFYKSLFSDIATLSQAHLLAQHIELFLDIKLEDFSKEFFENYFPKYVYLFDKVNVLALINYIDFTEGMKKEVLKDAFKKTVYPCFLFMSSVFTLFIFRNHLMGLLSDYTSTFVTVLIEMIYRITQLIVLSLLVFLGFVGVILKRKDYYLMTYRSFFKLKIFRLTELYNLKILTQLLLIAFEDGLSTHDTFLLMNSFKGETIVSNIAYFVSSDLEEGLGIDESLQNMRICHKFKRLLKFAIKSDDYGSFIHSYRIQLDYEFKNEINHLSKKMYAISYAYIFVVIILFYKILSLPLSLVQNI